MFVDRFLDWAYNGLLESEEAQAYLRGRGISSDQWERHRIGYTSGDFDVDSNEDPNHNRNCSDREAKSLWCDSCRYRSWSSKWEQVEGEPHKTQFVGRRIQGGVVFPLTSYSGSTVGFQVRSIAQKSYDTFAIKRRPEGYFFGTSVAVESIWSTGEVWIVEGPGDQLIMERLVAPNVLALTTSAVNKLQAKFLCRFVKKVNLCLDLDKAGREGVESFIRHLGSNFQVRDVKYPRINQELDKDPGDLWKKIGDHRFSQYFQKNILSTF